jgi:hypothetical protein
VDRPAIATELFNFLASQYLVGSILFLWGGLMNYRRAWILVLEGLRRRRERPARPAGAARPRSETAPAADGEVS